MDELTYCKEKKLSGNGDNSDDDKAEALVKRANMRGLELTDECARFLLTRLSRDMRALLDILDRLDHASMAAQRKLTIPFIKATLKL